MIKIQTYGRLASEPQLTDNRCNFSLAADTGRKASNGNGYTTEFFSVTVWGKRAETAATYLHKGDAIFVSGDYYSDEYTGRDNQKHLQKYINNAEFAFGARKNAEGVNSGEILPD